MSTTTLFAQNLKALRAHKNTTQQQVADAIGVKRGSYSGYENAAAEPDLLTLVRISVYHRMSLDTLLRREIKLASTLDHICQDGSRLMVGLTVNTPSHAPHHSGS